MIRMALTYWLSAAGGKAWIVTLFLIACTVLIVLLNMQINNWQVEFYSHLQRHSLSGFYDALVQFVLLSAITAGTSGWQTHFKLLLQIRWRQWLTDKYITLWLNNQTYFRMNFIANAVDNPDQRISEDINLFVTHSLDLATGLLRHIVTLIVFSSVLWQLSGELHFSLFDTSVVLHGYLVLSALFYSALGTWLTLGVGRPLMFQNNIQQSNEADFRYSLVRLKEHGESVALYKGDKQEKVNLLLRFATIVTTYLSIIRTTRAITWLTSAYSQFSIVFAFLIAAPRYFNEELQLGQLFEISGAYWYVHSALSYIIESFGKIAQWQAVTDRLNEFYNQLIKTVSYSKKKPVPQAFCKHNALIIKNLSIFTPGGHILLNKLTLEIYAGNSLLITGPSGCGKTTILRTLSGLWPYFDGLISFPQNHAMLFLPQKPYLPVGSLRSAILYPHMLDTSDAVLNECLTLCQLSECVPHLDIQADWSKVLSLGELQRLSLVRAILHQPEWLFLDETTSCIDSQMEQVMYQVLKEKLPASTIISIGHRDTLKAYHRQIVELNGTGIWHSTHSNL